MPCSIYRQAEKALHAELRKVHEAALAAYEAEAAEAADSRVKSVRRESAVTLKESLAAKEASLADDMAAMRAEKEAAEKALELREEAHAKALMNRALRYLQRASTVRAWRCWQNRARAFSLVRTTLRMMRLRTAARAKAACHGLRGSAGSGSPKAMTSKLTSVRPFARQVRRRPRIASGRLRVSAGCVPFKV